MILAIVVRVIHIKWLFEPSAFIRYTTGDEWFYYERIVSCCKNNKNRRFLPFAYPFLHSFIRNFDVTVEVTVTRQRK
jgi:hypothetical protein